VFKQGNFMEFTGVNKQYHIYKLDIDRAIQKVLNEGQFILGPEVHQLEEALAKYIGVKYCLGVSSGTVALQIAMMALDIGPGDEVITVPFTWIATAESIALLGAKPVFADIDPETYLMDLNHVETLITPRTKAIMPVSLFGQMPDFTALNAIAKKYGIAIIEDGAQSFGSTQKGVLSGSLTTIGCTSFFPTKPLGCYGDGGAVFTNDEKLAEKMKSIRTHGSVNRLDHNYLGINGRLDTLQAAILKVKLSYFNQEVSARQTRASIYNHLLKDYCEIPHVQEHNTHVYAQYTLRSPQRHLIMQHLDQLGIPVRIFYPRCIHLQKSFSYLNHQLGDLPEAEKASQEVFSLPMHPWLAEEDQFYVAKSIKEAL